MIVAMMAEAVMCKPFVEELTDDDSTFSTGSPVLKKAKVCTDSPSSVEETGSNKEMHEDEDQGDVNQGYEDESHDSDDDFRTYLNHIIDTKVCNSIHIIKSFIELQDASLVVLNLSVYVRAFMWI